jgi:Ni,Fe-hydrogenase III large subunit
VQRLPTHDELDRVGHRFEELVELASSNAFVMERFAGTATLDATHAHDLGLVGPTARASGVAFDARIAHPFVGLAEDFASAVHQGGDVLARYQIRVDEVRASLRLLADLLGQAGPLHAHAPRGSASEQLSGSGVGIAEGWRGAIVHRVELEGGLLARVKVVDPSFLNWPAIPVSLADTIVPDFPLANKSFNLSYAGNDL